MTPFFRSRDKSTILVGFLALGLARLAARPEIILPDFPCQKVAGPAVFFAFDPHAFPFTSHVQTHLVPGKFHSIVLEAGPKGAHDEVVGLYGSVQRIDGKFHMWYSGKYGDENPYLGYGMGLRPTKTLCYARSDDGIHWEKPNLGLVDYQGSKANNIVLIPGEKLGPPAVVLYDAEETNPAKRYKLAFEAYRDGVGRFCVGFSSDGLRWTVPGVNPVGAFFEMSGIARFNGRYYVCGQDSSRVHQEFGARRLVTFVSADFEHWSPCGSVGLKRSDALADLSGPSIESELNHREEVHLGAGLANRGNVILGIYGQFHGNATGDRRLVTIDLGLTVSHDGVHHQEPIPGFKFIQAREQPGSPAGESPALMQGQGMENVGDKTYYWYSLWKGTGATGVRLVTWDRDRFGMLRPIYAGGGKRDFQTVSAGFAVSAGSAANLFLNASGLGVHTSLRVNLLDVSFQPLSGFTAVVKQGGLHQPVAWENGRSLGAGLGLVHVQIKFEGVRPEDAKLHALYIEPSTAP